MKLNEYTQILHSKVNVEYNLIKYRLLYDVCCTVLCYLIVMCLNCTINYFLLMENIGYFHMNGHILLVNIFSPNYFKFAPASAHIKEFTIHEFTYFILIRAHRSVTNSTTNATHTNPCCAQPAQHLAFLRSKVMSQALPRQFVSKSGP